MYQLAFYTAGRRIQKNFKDKSEAKRVATQILRGLTLDTQAVDNVVYARPGKASSRRGRSSPPVMPCMWLQRSTAQAVVRLGKTSLREAVEFFLRHNRADVPRLTLAEIAEQFAASRQQSGLSAH